MLLTLAESFWNKPMPPWAVGAIVISSGVLMLVAAWRDWKWITEVRQFRGLFWVAGKERARIVGAVIGGVMILGGILLSFGLHF